jgi:putative phosphoesterase
MKIGIMSDTHKKLGKAKKVIDYFVAENVEYIIHAGDIVDIEVLKYIKETNIEYRAVYGNNDDHLKEYEDDYNLLTQPYYFYIKNKKIKLMHIPYYLDKDEKDVDINIFGHTHIVSTYIKNTKLFLNPGETCGRDTNYSNFLILDINDDNYKLKHYFRKSKSDIWDIKEIDLTTKKAN